MYGVTNPLSGFTRKSYLYIFCRSFGVMPTSRTLPKLTMRAWIRLAPLNSQPPRNPFRIGCMLLPNRSPCPTGIAPVPLGLDRVAHVRDGIHHAPVVEPAKRRGPFERVLVASVDGESVRQPPAQLDLERVVVAVGAAVGDVDRVGIRVDDEVIARDAGRERQVAPRQVAVEIGRGVRRADGFVRTRSCVNAVLVHVPVPPVGGGVRGIGPPRSVREIVGSGFVPVPGPK